MAIIYLLRTAILKHTVAKFELLLVKSVLVFNNFALLLESLCLFYYDYLKFGCDNVYVAIFFSKTKWRPQCYWHSSWF